MEIQKTHIFVSKNAIEIKNKPLPWFGSKRLETKNIKAWINVGGILRGSPIADNYLKAPKKLFAKFMLWIKGKKINIRSPSLTVSV